MDHACEHVHRAGPRCSAFLLAWSVQGILLRNDSAHHCSQPEEIGRVGSNFLTDLSIIQFLLAVAAFFVFHAPELGLGARRRMTRLVPGFYFVALYGLWPGVTRSRLSFVLRSVLICTPDVLFLADWLASRIPRVSVISFLGFLVVGQIAWTIGSLSRTSR